MLLFNLYEYEYDIFFQYILEYIQVIHLHKYILMSLYITNIKLSIIFKDII